MRETTLEDYFNNIISAETLNSDAEGSATKTSYDVISVEVIQIENHGKYLINKAHLLRLCNDTIAGSITIPNLTTIAFTLICSDYFSWDDDIIGDVIFDWDNPDINHPITIANLNKWKHYLETGEYLL
jgi:hypothetical protein